ncbi:MAG: protein translocase subunit SecD [bacterium]|nr:protein translocase subunit SecD [bacterium]
MLGQRIFSLVLVVGALLLAYFVYTTEVPQGRFAFKLGLDLRGGSHLVYRADVSQIKGGEVDDSMQALRDVIERRVNAFGVSEPLVQVEHSTIASEERLIVELPGVTSVEEAKRIIGGTPVLEFKLLPDALPSQPDEVPSTDAFIPTGLTGRYLERAALEFDETTGEPYVSLNFNSEGTKLFAEITRQNIGKILAIILDGVPISKPVVRDEITDGKAVISGGFTPEEAKELVRNLNYGSLPVPIELVSTDTIGPTLGAEAVASGVRAALIGLGLVALFMLVWYRLPGLIAIVALSLYVLLNLSIFKLVPVVLTASGIAGFILSVGMAVDANILIFERIKDELRAGKDPQGAVRNGFSRAWFSIRDANLTTIIVALILFWLGTPLIKGFALTMGLGVLVSMFSAITVTRTFLLSLGIARVTSLTRFLFGTR